jgi:phosphoketolase
MNRNYNPAQLSNDEGGEADVVVASAGDILTQETLGAVTILVRACRI